MPSARSVRILVGPRHRQTTVIGSVVTDARGYVSLARLVPGGDPGASDRYRRFRTVLFRMGRSDGSVACAHGSGTWFHPRHLPAFLETFGRSGSPDNDAVLAAVPELVRACDGTSDVPTRTGEADREAAARDASVFLLATLVPAHLTVRQTLDRLGYPVPPSGDARRVLRRARVDMHPDNHRRRQGATVETAVAAEEIFKLLGRFDDLLL